MSERTTKLRLVFAGAFLLLAMTGLGARLALLHLGVREEVRVQVDRKRRTERTLLARRGTIFDRGGRDNKLAMSLAVKDVCADPKVIQEKERVIETASFLAEALDVPVDELAVRLNRPDRRYEYVRRFVPEEDLAAIREAELPGVFFENAVARYYPQGAFLCHVLGFVNDEGIGSAGVEQCMHRYLQGCDGVVENRVDALRRELYWEDGRHIPPIGGADVELTIDQTVQYIVEQALDRVMEKHRARGAWAVVEAVRTGAILAMASRPAYDPNRFRYSTPEQRRNCTVGYVYEPGSTLKALTFAAAFNEGVVTEDTLFDCEHGSWFHNGRLLRDYHGYGRLTVADGLKKSSNILSAKVALLLGEKRMYAYMRRFGLGAPLGIDLPGEEAGILHPVQRWSNISLSRHAIGQGVAVTALQMAGIFCAIANDGFLMRPHVVRRVTGRDGAVLLRREAEVLGRPVRAETARRMRRLLGRVCEEGGTGRRARVEGYQVAGKTGTAEKAIPGGYSATDYMASFAGFLPAEAPEIVIVVVVDTPRGVHTGGRVAGPAFREIAEQAVRYLDIPPVETPAMAKR